LQLVCHHRSQRVKWIFANIEDCHHDTTTYPEIVQQSAFWTGRSHYLETTRENRSAENESATWAN
jgi:hypothetical protein